jgi:actin-related protein
MEIKTKTIIIDFGVRFSKVGFEGDSEPRKIVPTPSLINLEDFFEEKSKNFNILSYLKDSAETKLEIEEFACFIINDVLQIYKTDSKFKLICIILLDLDLKDNFKEIYLSFIKYIYETFPFISSIKIIPKNIFPIFTSGLFSGIILNSGYLFSKVTVVNNGISVFSKEIGFGSCDAQKMLYNIILNDKKGMEIVRTADQENFKKKLVNHMDDILVRVTYIMNKKVSEEYKQVNKENEKPMYMNYSFYDDLPSFNISFNSRVIIGEKLFGSNSEDNLAYAVLKIMLEKVPCEIRRKIGSNIILSGGLTMLNGFYQRFVDEISHIVNNNAEFMRLKGVKDDLHVHKIIFPRNILAWVGASLFLNFNNLNSRGNEINRDENAENFAKDMIETEIVNLLDNLRV